VGIIVGVDATSGKDSDVNALQVAGVGQVEGTDNVVSDGLLLVVFAPINIWSASGTGSIEDVGGLVFLELSNDRFSVLHANGGRVDLLALRFEEGLEMTSDPSFTTPDEEDVLRRHVYEMVMFW